MLALKRIVTVAVMIYLLLSLLFILAPAVRSSLMGAGDELSSLAQERQFFYVMFVVGAIVLALHLVTENMDSSLLRRSVSQQENKINELKAKLYDHQQRTATVVVPESRAIDSRTTEPHPALTFPQTGPSLPNTPPAERTAL